jgi:pimeloyl-ACP methyl ester carboxylesterase
MERSTTFERAPVEAASPIEMHEVRGGGGLTLHVREWGNPRGRPLLFIHGWSQSQMCWARQVSGALAERFRIVTFDIRGHGMSEKPLESDRYTDERLWADDLAAVIEETRLERALVVAWSYGGFVVSDYIRAYGAGAIGGIDLVGGAWLMNPPRFDHIGPGFLETPRAPVVPICPPALLPSSGFSGRAAPDRLALESGAPRCAGTWSSHPRSEAR